MRDSRSKKTESTPKVEMTLAEIDDRIYDVFCNHGFKDFPHNKRQELTQFCNYLLKAQKQLNLTRLLKVHEIALKHFIDSLIITQHWDLKFPLIDLGTGPGFPGIPLKIMYPDQKVILVESVRKRVDYLKNIRDNLKLKDLDILGRKFDEDFNYPCASFITRALQMEAPEILKCAQNSLTTGGEVVLMKGPAVDGEDLKGYAENTSMQLKKVIPYNLPNSPHERRLVIYEKL